MRFAVSEIFSVIYFSIILVSYFSLCFKCYLLSWLCTGDPVRIPLIKRLLFRGQGVLTKGAGGREMGMSAHPLCITVSVMKI